MRSGLMQRQARDWVRLIREIKVCSRLLKKVSPQRSYPSRLRVIRAQRQSCRDCYRRICLFRGSDSGAVGPMPTPALPGWRFFARVHILITLPDGSAGHSGMLATWADFDFATRAYHRDLSATRKAGSRFRFAKWSECAALRQWMS